jgi:hypothetical protein
MSEQGVAALIGSLEQIRPPQADDAPPVVQKIGVLRAIKAHTVGDAALRRAAASMPVVAVGLNDEPRRGHTGVHCHQSVDGELPLVDDRERVEDGVQREFWSSGGCGPLLALLDAPHVCHDSSVGRSHATLLVGVASLGAEPRCCGAVARDIEVGAALRTDENDTRASVRAVGGRVVAATRAEALRGAQVAGVWLTATRTDDRPDLVSEGAFRHA